MLTSKEEKLFKYCEEELWLHIEHPYENPHEHDSLIERLATIHNCFEVLLYKQTLIKGRCSEMPTTIESLTLYSVPELSQMLNVTTVSIRNYINSGRLKGQKVMGRWFVSEEDWGEFFNKLS